MENSISNLANDFLNCLMEEEPLVIDRNATSTQLGMAKWVRDSLAPDHIGHNIKSLFLRGASACTVMDCECGQRLRFIDIEIYKLNP